MTTLLRASLFAVLTAASVPTIGAGQDVSSDSLLRRIESLERRTADLERRVHELQTRGTVEPSRGRLGSTSPNWRDVQNWRQLRRGMNMDQVRALLGEPERVDAGRLTYWHWADAHAYFVSDKLEGWSEPRRQSPDDFARIALAQRAAQLSLLPTGTLTLWKRPLRGRILCVRPTSEIRRPNQGVKLAALGSIIMSDPRLCSLLRPPLALREDCRSLRLRRQADVSAPSSTRIVDFPGRLEVLLVAADLGAPLGSILVALDIHVHGRYYFGTVLGLTDSSGAVATDRHTVERDFRRNQELFPMDYRVALAGCDSTIAIRVQGGREFQEAQSAAVTNEFMSEEDRSSWAAAQNGPLTSASLTVDLTEHPRDVVRVLVPVSTASHNRSSTPPN